MVASLADMKRDRIYRARIDREQTMELVRRLRYLTSCDAEAMPDYERINRLCVAGREAAIKLAGKE